MISHRGISLAAISAHFSIRTTFSAKLPTPRTPRPCGRAAVSRYRSRHSPVRAVQRSQQPCARRVRPPPRRWASFLISRLRRGRRRVSGSAASPTECGCLPRGSARRRSSKQCRNGASLTIHATGGNVMVDNATVSTADIACSTVSPNRPTSAGRRCR